MKLEEAQKRYSEISKELIDKMKQKLSLSQKLQHSNKVYRETKKSNLKPWEHKHMTAEIKVLEDEIKLLEEERKQLMRDVQK